MCMTVRADRRVERRSDGGPEGPKAAAYVFCGFRIRESAGVGVSAAS